MTERLKVLTWLWHQPEGRVHYDAAHVRIWAGMIRRHLTIPHTLAVVTDLPGDYGRDVEVIAPTNEFLDVVLPRWGVGRPQCLRRLSMFRRDAADLFGADRLVCMDLDLVVSGSLDPVLDIRDDFRIFRGTANNRLYNGSMMSIRLGSRTAVYDRFNVAEAVKASGKFVGSDQAWISHILGRGQPTWGHEHGVDWWGSGRPAGDTTRVMFFPGAVKPWRLAETGHSYVARHYRAEPQGAGLILGYSPSIWDDLAGAVDRRFAGIIASPEAARHWPGSVLAVADDDTHAERLARMHGLTDITWCGRQPERMAA